ncbi:hypothetical protein AWC38_SpisGene7639 [Stylophora pistillata]|uniref:Helix-turn-helix domain-containing protein n=1 Tax=Stylophora pistillata TaxID=50429 RepID=A0A2B4SGR5_STYPI|nr:hypothetical protein AWC38_SpisGene7639 [Stylophora pistillata]
MIARGRKKSASNLFDVTMGTFDGAETCELVGCFLLSILTEKYGQNIGLYRDDGLAALNGTPQEIENIKKGFCKVFRDNDLKITVEANITKTNFLDVTLDLSSGKYYPFTKEGNIPLYVHKKSNHPPSILRNIPESINRRLSEISSDRECFDSAKPIYQEALKKSGYSYTLSFNAASNQAPRPRRNRQRNITWFNPPYSKNVETNVGKCFLALIDKHFTKTNPLHKIFNRNTLKLSYSCMGSIKTVISNHNKSEIRKLARANDRARKSCNCRKPDICPMDGNCNMESIIYQAEVTTETAKETYIGLCDTAFKMRYRNHLCSFRNERYRHATELSKYIWSLKDKDTKFNIKWRKIGPNMPFEELKKEVNDNIAKEEQKRARLKELDLIVLDNSLRESTVGQLRSHTLENKRKIFEEVRKCGFQYKIVAAYSHMPRVDDTWVEEIVSNCKEGKEDLHNLFAFSEDIDSVSQGIPDIKTIPVGLRKMQEDGLINPIIEIDLATNSINWEKFTTNDMCQLLTERFKWSRAHLNPDAKILVNLRDFPNAMREEMERAFTVVDYLASMPAAERPFGILFEEPTGKYLPEEVGAWTAGKSGS